MRHRPSFASRRPRESSSRRFRSCGTAVRRCSPVSMPERRCDGGASRTCFADREPEWRRSGSMDSAVPSMAILRRPKSALQIGITRIAQQRGQKPWQLRRRDCRELRVSRVQDSAVGIVCEFDESLKDSAVTHQVLATRSFDSGDADARIVGVQRAVRDGKAVRCLPGGAPGIQIFVDQTERLGRVFHG